MLSEASEDAPTRPRLMWFARTERDALAKRARHIERINHAWAVGTRCRPDFTLMDCPETGQSTHPSTHHEELN